MIIDIDPVAFSVFGIDVRWYGLAYVAGFLLALQYLKWAITKYPTGQLKPEHADDMFVWTVLGVILGGRLGYVLFYNPQFYFENPEHILQVWQGGMSFHGGFVGVLLSLVWMAKRYQTTFFDLTDRLAPGACFGLFFGRIANFINGELYGRTTDVPWAMIFPQGGPETRHPSQLYEAGLEGLLLFLILHLAFRRQYKRMQVSGLFLIGYGLSRITVEFFREPDEHLSEGLFTIITMGQILSLPMIAIGLLLIWKAKKA